jgi:hypothetical protein
MPLALVTVTLAQLLDLTTFVRMIDVLGPGAEANPLVTHLLADLGLPFVMVAKVAALSLIVAEAVVLAGRDGDGRHRRAVAVLVTVGVVAGLIGGWSNAVVLAGWSV